MKNCISGLVMALVVSFFTTGCASSRMDVWERVEIPVLLNGQVYTNAFERTDKSRIAPGGPRTYHRGNGGSFFRFRAEVGGSPAPSNGYGGGGYGPTYYPMAVGPITDQERHWENTQRQYGISGGGTGSYSPTRSGSYTPTPMGGSYSPTPMR
jgi:hypothetical protein